MIRSLCAKMKLGVKKVWTQALACTLLAAGAVQAQSPGALLPPPAASTPATVAPNELGTSVLGAPTQGIPVPPRPVNAPGPVSATAIVDTNVVPASGCASCGSGPGNAPGDYGYSGGGCVPGRRGCNWCYNDSVLGRFLGGIYEGICCPDPCYEPMWIPEANAAFFQDGPRPVTQTRIRWDAGQRYSFPDTAEFFWAQIGKKGPNTNTPTVNYNDLTLYQEVAAKGASFFIELPYRNIDPVLGPSSAGFGDMNLGVKTVLLDRELLLISTQLRTYIPTGNPTVGLGTGHVSIEPALLTALKLCPHTYLQMELADWIPFGGTPGFAGSVFSYHFSLNQQLCQAGDFLKVIGTLEFNGFTFRGAFTDVNNNIVGMMGSSYANLGPGLRVQVCNNVDIGVGMGFDVTNGHGPAQIYRSELRIRY